MEYNIRMGKPEVDAYWQRLRKENQEHTLSKEEKRIYDRWEKALKLLKSNPRHRSLKSHEIEELSKRYGMKVWQSYLENNVSRAMRMYWVYAPNEGDITIIGIEPHPEDKKNGAYDRIPLSEF